jgi:hypothetical protein
MRVALHEVSKGHALPTTSLEFHTGAVRYAIAETEQRPTVLGLIASGRMTPATGRVTIDGATDGRMLRRTIALVDAPDVSDPHPDIALAGVVGEELMFAGRRATPLHARRWLNELGFGELASVQIGNIDPSARVRILCELAILREGTEGIVLVSPDRHGGSPDGWWRIAREFAERGYAMLVIVGGSAAVALERMQELGAVNASGPIEPLVLDLAEDEAPADADADADADVDTEARAESDTDADPHATAPSAPDDVPADTDTHDAAPGAAAPHDERATDPGTDTDADPADAITPGVDTPDVGPDAGERPTSGVSAPGMETGEDVADADDADEENGADR